MKVCVTARVVLAVSIELNDADSKAEAKKRVRAALEEGVFTDVLDNQFADHKHSLTVEDVEITS
jgi:hypothetical protein